MATARTVLFLTALALLGCDESEPYRNTALCDPDYLANIVRDERGDSRDVTAYQCIGRRALAAAAQTHADMSIAAREVVQGCMAELRQANQDTEELGRQVGHPDMGARKLESDILAAEAHAMFVISRAHHCFDSSGSVEPGA